MPLLCTAYQAKSQQLAFCKTTLTLKNYGFKNDLGQGWCSDHTIILHLVSNVFKILI